MVIFNLLGEPIEFTCVGGFCNGGPHPIGQRSARRHLDNPRQWCNACNAAQRWFHDACEDGASKRLGLATTNNCELFRELPEATQDLEKQREEGLLLAGISTENERWNQYCQQRELNNPLTNDENNPVVDVTPEPEDTPAAPNHGTAIHQDLQAGEGGGQQIAATNGHVYILTHPLMDGWLKIGMTRYPNARLRSYNTGDPESRYHMEHTVGVDHQRNAESAAHELAELADSFEGRSETGRREWFMMSLEDAQAILNQIGTPLENGD
jgi:hypothetical protein